MPTAVRAYPLLLLALLALSSGCTGRPAESTPAEDAARAERLRAEGLKQFRGQVANGATSFDLIRTLADDEWMAVLKDQPIVSLSIVNRPVTDDGLANLAGNTALKELLMDGSKITDAGMKYLETMPNLENVSLSAEITDAGLVHVKGLKNLKVINLSDKITDAGLPHLVGLAELESVGPLSTGVTGKGIDTLAPLKNLSGINLFNSPIADADLDKLAQFPELSHLTLSGTKITDAGLLKLAKLPKLQVLFITNVAGITDQGVQKLIEAKPSLKDGIVR